jgi:hypothetical protein
MSRRGQRGDENRRKSCGKDQLGHSSLLMWFLFSGPVRKLIDGNPYRDGPGRVGRLRFAAWFVPLALEREMTSLDGLQPMDGSTDHDLTRLLRNRSRAAAFKRCQKSGAVEGIRAQLRESSVGLGRIPNRGMGNTSIQSIIFCAVRNNADPKRVYRKDRRKCCDDRRIMVGRKRYPPLWQTIDEVKGHAANE